MAARAEVPPPSATPARIIVSGNTSTAVDITVIKVGQQIPKTYAGEKIANTPGFEFYVSAHYALKSNMGDEFSRHILEISELAYPHWVAITGLEPPDPDTRMYIVYASDAGLMCQAMTSDCGMGPAGYGGGITIWANSSAYNYPSGTLMYHRRDLVIHENLHMLQCVALRDSMGTESMTYPGANHVYDEHKKQLTVAVFDKATTNNPIDEGLTELQTKEFWPIEKCIEHYDSGGGIGAVYSQFFWTDPDRFLKWQIWRDEYYQGRLNTESNARVMEDVFGPLDKLNESWKTWLQTRHHSFHFVEWGWEQAGNELVSYGWPWNPAHYSQTDLLYKPSDKTEYDPYRMDYPAEPMPPTVGPVQRGIEEPSVGCMVDFSRDPARGMGGLGLGVAGTDLCPVVINAREQLIIGGNATGIVEKTTDIPAAMRLAAAQDGQRFGLTVQLKKSAIAVTVRAGKAGAMKEMKESVRITPEQRERLMNRRMAIIAKGGYQGVTPFIDDARKHPPDLMKPAAPNFWRFDGLDRLLTLCKAAWRLKANAPDSLRSLKAEMLEAVEQQPAVQAKAVKAYEDHILEVVHDVRQCQADVQAKSLAMADLTGTTFMFSVAQGPAPDAVRLETRTIGRLEDRVECNLSFAMSPRTPALLPAPLEYTLQAHRPKTVTSTCQVANPIAPATFTAILDLRWRGELVRLALTQPFPKAHPP